MSKTVQLVISVISMLSFLAADTASIGTVTARGEFRVDSHIIRSNATLFNGSIVETGAATADLRMDKGTAITMSTNSRGTLYSDHLVLEQGKSEFTGSKAFHLEANSLHVMTTESNSQGVVSISPGNTVEVAALSGAFSVTNDQGIMLAKVVPGQTMSFAMQAGASSTAFKATGRISVDIQDGKYYLTDSKTGVKYQLVGGKNLAKLVDKEVTVKGTVSATGGATAAGATVAGATVAGATAAGATAAVTVASISVVGALTATAAAVVAGVVILGVSGAAVGVYEANQSTPPASP